MSAFIPHPAELLGLLVLAWFACGWYTVHRAANHGRLDWEAIHTSQVVVPLLAALGLIGLVIYLLVVEPRFAALDRPEVFS